MPTPAAETEQPGVGAAAKQVAEHASTLARLELELAGLELKQKAGSFGVGLGLGVGATVVALYAVGFLFATAAVALAVVVDLWLAVLIVALALFAVAALLGLLARSRIKKATPPVPEQAIREAKLTSEALRSNDHH
jgi:uncharacterized membrane protein YqjE